jgi:hypothetical protein
MDHIDRRANAASELPARGRDSLYLNANLRRVGDERVTPVRVRNLSSGGLMAEVADPLDADAAVEIEVRGLGWIKGRIAWHTEGRAGIAFDREIDPQRARKPVSGKGEDDSRPVALSVR